MTWAVPLVPALAFAVTARVCPLYITQEYQRVLGIVPQQIDVGDVIVSPAENWVLYTQKRSAVGRVALGLPKWLGGTSPAHPFEADWYFVIKNGCRASGFVALTELDKENKTKQEAILAEVRKSGTLVSGEYQFALTKLLGADALLVSGHRDVRIYVPSLAFEIGASDASVIGTVRMREHAATSASFGGAPGARLEY